MKNPLILVLATLMLLSAATALVATFVGQPKQAAWILLLIALMKIMLVALRFMELRLAHPFWKTALLLMLVVIGAAILLAA